jgi:hypothetical protein
MWWLNLTVGFVWVSVGGHSHLVMETAFGLNLGVVESYDTTGWFLRCLKIQQEIQNKRQFKRNGYLEWPLRA